VIETASILQLIAAIQRRLHQRATVADAIGDEAARVLALLDPLPPLTGAFPPSEHPSTRHLEAAFTAGNGAGDDATAALLAAIRPVAFHLPWRYGYTKRSDAPGLEGNMAWGEIIGPDAPYASERVCLGLTLIGPNTLYPPHRHPAIELYYVVTGEATWTADGVARRNPPHAFILHGSQIVHSMKTHEEPLLAVYTWSGADIRNSSVYI